MFCEAESVDATARKFNKSADEVTRILASGRETLFQLRTQRPRPFLDDKVLTAWNGMQLAWLQLRFYRSFAFVGAIGLMLSGFARAAQVLNEPRYLAAAARAVEFFRTTMFDESTQTLRRTFRYVFGFLALVLLCIDTMTSEGPSNIEAFFRTTPSWFRVCWTCMMRHSSRDICSSRCFFRRHL